jgi:putative transposase
MKRERKSIRLMDYDYAGAGYYFVTVCVAGMACVFGDVIAGEMVLNKAGKIVRDEWMRSQEIRDEIRIDDFIIMPNHMHMIIEIVGANGRSPLRNDIRKKCMQSKSISSLMAGFKSICTKKINQFRCTPGKPVWQRNYYEHIIRTEKDLFRIRKYIRENPANWQYDDYNPRCVR